MPTRERRNGRRAERRLDLAGRRRENVAIVLMFAAPAMIVPGALDRFVFGKLLAAATACALAFSLPPAGALTRRVGWLVAAGVGLLLVSALTSGHVVSALVGRAPRYEGVFVLATYVLVALSGARLLGPNRSPSALRVVVTTVSYVVIAVAALAVLEAFGWRPLSSNLDRPGSLLGSASDEGAFGVLCAGPLVVHAVRTRAPLPSLGAAAAITTVVLSASRGAMLGLVVALMITAVLIGPGRRYVLGALAAAAALALAVPAVRERMLGASGLAGHTVGGRRLLWQETVRLLGGHPVLGTGPSQFENAIVARHDLRWQSQVGPANPPDSPHDWILQVLDAGGPLLLMVVVWLAVLLVRAAVRADASPLAAGGLAALGGYAVTLLFHFTSPGTTALAAALAGAVLAVPAAEPAPAGQAAVRGPAVGRAPGWTRAAVVTVSILLAAVFTCASAAEILLKQGTQDVAAGDLGGADSAFAAARALRIWDVDLPAGVTHEFVVAAAAGDAAALPYGRRWLARSTAVGDDEQLVEDHAGLLEAAHDVAGARRLLTHALRRDADNPLLLLRRGVVSAELHRYPDAERDFLHAARISRSSPEPWQDLATLYRQEGDTALASSAAAHARRLARPH